MISIKNVMLLENFDKSGGPGTHWVAWYKTIKLKFTLIVTVCNLRSKLLSNWEVKYVITPIHLNHFAATCVYMFSKNLARVNNFKNFSDKLF